MFKKTIMKIIFLLIFFVLVFNSVSVISFGNNKIYKTNMCNYLYVGGEGPQNFSSIQDAIDAARTNNTIFVYRGEYDENLVINKSLIIIGENNETTIINGKLKGDTVTIKSENVTIKGFCIINGSSFDPSDICKAGIRVTKSNCIIKDNIIKNNNLGIFGLRVTNLTITNNKFYDDGITFSPYENEARPACLRKYFIHAINNNKVNNKKLYYLKDQKNINISDKEIGQLLMNNCSNMTFYNISISNTDSGIQMSFSNNCRIMNSNISNNEGIWTFNCDDNVFESNIFSYNFHGITLDYHSNNNIVTKNKVFNNQMAGVMIEYHSINNIITKNNLINNKYPGYFTQAYRNKWDNNYYSNWIGLKYKKLSFSPKVILGRPFDLYPKIGICFKIDRNPAEKPYEI